MLLSPRLRKGLGQVTHGRGIGSVSNNRNNKNLSEHFHILKMCFLLDRNWLHMRHWSLPPLFSSKYPQVPSDVATDLQVW